MFLLVKMQFSGSEWECLPVLSWMDGHLFPYWRAIDLGLEASSFDLEIDVRHGAFFRQNTNTGQARPFRSIMIFHNRQQPILNLYSYLLRMLSVTQSIPIESIGLDVVTSPPRKSTNQIRGR